MNGVNFLQVVEELEEKHLTIIGGEVVYAYVGKSTGKLVGFKVVKEGKDRRIFFHDIDNMKKILETMGGKKDGL